jgi:HD-GYP domain-containing protein (c-di-GMP phosphodiesterase class II)
MALGNVFQQLAENTRGFETILLQRHIETAAHCQRVEALCVGLGRRCRFDTRELDRLDIAGKFHDIGKIGIPDRVLLKNGALSEIEWEIMKKHSEQGAQILGDSQLRGSQNVAVIIRHHHERFDGSGYPDGLRGDDIPLCSRIVSIADSYDALSEDRPYRDRWSHKKIMRIMGDMVGKMYDPDLFSRFARFIERSPFRAA